MTTMLADVTKWHCDDMRDELQRRIGSIGTRNASTELTWLQLKAAVEMMEREFRETDALLRAATTAVRDVTSTKKAEMANPHDMCISASLLSTASMLFVQAGSLLAVAKQAQAQAIAARDDYALAAADAAADAAPSEAAAALFETACNRFSVADRAIQTATAAENHWSRFDVTQTQADFVTIISSSATKATDAGAAIRRACNKSSLEVTATPQAGGAAGGVAERTIVEMPDAQQQQIDEMLQEGVP